MYNEATTAFKMTMTTMDSNYLLVLPINYREKNTKSNGDVQNHFIAGLYSVDKELHLLLWESLLKISTMSLNLVRQSIIHPHLSDYTHTFGEFDYKYTPLSPPETRVVIHNSPKDRT